MLNISMNGFRNEDEKKPPVFASKSINEEFKNAKSKNRNCKK